VTVNRDEAVVTPTCPACGVELARFEQLAIE